MAKSVLVVGCDDRSGLTVIRSLGRAGIAVDIAWPSHRLATKSRYVRKILDLPAPNNGSGAWLDALIKLLDEHRYDLLLPCDDNAIIPIQRHKDLIAKHVQVYALSDEAFLATFDKYRTTLLAESCGIRLPRWSLVRAPQEIDAVSAAFSPPLVLKPISSFDLAYVAERREVQIIPNGAEFVPALKKMLSDGAVLVQRYFKGEGVGVNLLVRDGQILAASQDRFLHEPPAGGNASYRVSAPLDPSLFDAARTLAAALQYTGVMMVEFHVNPVSGDWILIEINGRFWGSLPLAYAAGMDFPLYLFQMLVEGRTNFSSKYRMGIYCRHLRFDVSWFKKNFFADPNDPMLRIVPLTRICAELINILTLSEHIDTFAIDDPKPFFAEVGELAGRVIRKVIGLINRWTCVLIGEASARLFDWRFGTETNKILDRCDLDVPEEKRKHAWSYEPVTPPRFHKAMKLLDIKPESFTFIDIGSGRGRQLILAEQMGFGSVVGVEFAPSLHASAVKNIDIYQRRGRGFNILALKEDATALVFPPGNLVIFMFNPFQYEVMNRFLENLKHHIKNRPEDQIFIVYIHPTEGDLVQKLGFKPIAELGGQVDAVVYELAHT